MTPEQEMLGVLRELDACLETAWNERILPASVISGELVRKMRDVIRRASAPEVPEGGYDRAIQALAPYLPDGWIFQNAGIYTKHSTHKPRIHEFEDAWAIPYAEDREDFDFHTSIVIPQCPDWRTSLRRVEKGRVVQ